MVMGNAGEAESWEPSSNSGRIARAFLDPTAHGEGQFPPVLTAAALDARLNSKDLVERHGVDTEEARIAGHFQSLVRLAYAGHMRIVPLPEGQDTLTQVGFQFTDESARAAIVGLRAHHELACAELDRAAKLFNTHAPTVESAIARQIFSVLEEGSKS